MGFEFVWVDGKCKKVDEGRCEIAEELKMSESVGESLKNGEKNF
jgi:hypothetical protein